MFFFLSICIGFSLLRADISAAAFENESSLATLFLPIHDDMSQESIKAYADLQQVLKVSDQEQIPLGNKGSFMFLTDAYLKAHDTYPLLFLAIMGNKACSLKDIPSLRSILSLCANRFLKDMPEDREDFEKIKTTFPLFSNLLIDHIFKKITLRELFG